MFDAGIMNFAAFASNNTRPVSSYVIFAPTDEDASCGSSINACKRARNSSTVRGAGADGVGVGVAVACGVGCCVGVVCGATVRGGGATVGAGGGVCVGVATLRSRCPLVCACAAGASSEQSKSRQSIRKAGVFSFIVVRSLDSPVRDGMVVATQNAIR